MHAPFHFKCQMTVFVTNLRYEGQQESWKQFIPFASCMTGMPFNAQENDKVGCVGGGAEMEIGEQTGALQIGVS